MVEFLVVAPLVLLLGLGAVQIGLVFHAKSGLSYALQEAARAGAVNHADRGAIEAGLVRGLAPYMGGSASAAEYARTQARVRGEFARGAAAGWIRMRQRSPTAQSFADWAQNGFDEGGAAVREIPNASLAVLRCTQAPNGGAAGVKASSACGAGGERVGLASQQTLADANLLKLELTYGVRLAVPLINRIVVRALSMAAGCDAPGRQSLGPLNLGTARGGGADALACAAYQAVDANGNPEPRLPVNLAVTVRMQSPARFAGSRGWFEVVERTRAAHTGGVSLGNGRVDAASRFAPIALAQLNPRGVSSGEDRLAGSGNGALRFGADTDWNAPGDGPPWGQDNDGNPRSECGDEGDSSPVPRPSFPFPTTPRSPASLPVELPSLSVGNPIHVVTGNKYEYEEDLPALPGVLGLRFARHYNSRQAGAAGRLGAGWRHSYQAELIRDPQDRQRLGVRQADGRWVRFERMSAGHYRGVRAGDGVLSAAGDGHVWRWRSGRELHFDAEDRLIRIQEGRAQLQLRYGAHDELTQVIDPQGRTLRLHYDANGLLQQAAAPGGAVRYRYDARGNLRTARLPDQSVRAYEYGDARHPHHLTGLTVRRALLARYGQPDESVRIARWAYDDQGRGVLSTHPDDAGQVRLVYGAGYTEVTDAFGRVSRYLTAARQGAALVTEVRGPGCGTCGKGDVEYRYNERLQATHVRLKHAAAMQYRYDEQDRLIEILRHSDGVAERVVQYHYAGAELRRIERPSVKPGAVHVLILDYTQDGRLERVTERGYAPQANGAYRPIERAIALGYDAAGRWASLDGPRTDVRDVLRMQYDAQHRLVGVTHADGLKQRIDEFDALGRPVRMGVEGRPQVRLQYDAMGRVTRVTQLEGAASRSVQYEYDVAGRLTRIIDAQGRSLEVGYDAAGRADRITDADGLTRSVQFAPDDQMRAVRLSDAQGRVLRALSYSYDAQRRLQAVRDQHGRRLRAFEYSDADARPDQLLDALGVASLLRYDEQGRLSEIQAGDGGLTRLSRTPGLASLTAPNGAVTASAFDDFGRRVREDSADRGATDYLYDAAGNLIEKRDARGVRTRYRYDAANRVVRIERSDAVTQLRYAQGRLRRIWGPWGEERFAYDPQGRLTLHARIIDGRRFTSEYSYDAAGRLSARTLPGGLRLRHHYGADGRLRAITRERLFGQDVLVGELESAPAPSGRLIYGNGLIMQTHLDPHSGRIERRTTPGVQQFNYTYDEAGRITGVDLNGQRHRYQYDAVGRLTDARTPLGEFRYSYDPNGNRLTAQASNGAAREAVTHYDYAPASNRLTKIAGDAASDYRYDAAGHPTHIGAQRYEYDGAGRPIKLYLDQTLRASYAYNAWGERIKKVVYVGEHKTVSYFFYDDHQLTAEADASGRITQQYLYLGHAPVVTLLGKDVYFVHTDHLGAPRALTDEDQRVVWRAQYAPFGRAAIDPDPDRDGEPITLNLRFPGQYEDPEAGTYYNYFRDYDPATGRYRTSDPIGLAGGANTYAYAGVDPLNYIDPLGLARLQYILIDNWGGDPLNPGRRTLAGGVDMRLQHFAFYLTDIAGAPGQSLIYDPNGTFTGLNAHGAVAWNASQTGRNHWDRFTNHYADSISTGDWAVIGDFDDNAAARLFEQLAHYNPRTGASLAQCTIVEPAIRNLPPLPQGFFELSNYAFPTYVHLLTRPIFFADQIPNANDTRYVNLATIPWGDVTFNAEGQDNPTRAYYTRTPHTPPGPSGITIGRGYDLGQHTAPQIRSLLTRAGLPPNQINLLAGAARLRGAAARAYFNTNANALQAVNITREAQYLIYLQTYDQSHDSTRAIYETYIRGANGVDWLDLSETVRDVLIDMRFRGDLRYISATNHRNHPQLSAAFRDAVRADDAGELCRVFVNNQQRWLASHVAGDDTSGWGIPEQRLRQRVAALNGGIRNLTCP